MGDGTLKRPGGFTLVECMVALTIFCLFMVSIAKANYLIAQRFYDLSGSAARAGAMMEQANAVAALPFDSLDNYAGTSTFTTSSKFTYTRKIVLDSLSSSVKQVTVIVTPTNTAFKADTVVFDRSAPGSNPLDQ